MGSEWTLFSSSLSFDFFFGFCTTTGNSIMVSFSLYPQNRFILSLRLSRSFSEIFSILSLVSFICVSVSCSCTTNCCILVGLYSFLQFPTPFILFPMLIFPSTLYPDPQTSSVLSNFNYHLAPVLSIVLPVVSPTLLIILSVTILITCRVNLAILNLISSGIVFYVIVKFAS